MLYELMVIGTVDGGDLFNKIEKILKNANASNVSSENLGRKTLAYPIAKQTEAEYYLFNFEAEGESVGKINSILRVEEDALLRHLIVKKKVRKNKKHETRDTKQEAEEKKESKPEVKAKVTVKTKTKTAEAKTVKPRKAKESKPKKETKKK